ncbi:MAG: 30S ribosomal protein S13 [bacterium]|nr:30S ribosomal protein S13 [bacterium]
MARVVGANIPNEKRVEVALTYIFGIGSSASKKILSALKINPDLRVKDLTENDLNKIREYIDKNYQVEADLVRQVTLNIKRLKEINTYKGLRHKANLPVRGQRTKTNARTKRGKRMTVGSGRKKATAKT